MVITVKTKLRITGSFVPNGPQHVRLIIFIERVLHVNEEETPVFLLSIMISQEDNLINATIYLIFHPSIHLFSTARLLFLLYLYLQYALHDLFPPLPPALLPYSCRDQSFSLHDRVLGGP